MAGWQDRTGCPDKITKITREVFNEAFTQLGGVPALVSWAKKDNNMGVFYTLFAKVLPKEIKTENMNRTHEQFIELMKQEEEKNILEAGKPLELVDDVSRKEKKMLNVT